MSDDATEQITLDELLDIALDARLAEVHTSLPAQVVEYHRTAGTVKVSFPIQRMIPDGAGNYVAEGYPTLDDVPIEWPRCGKYSITFPLEPGDTGRVSFCMVNIGPWRTTGAVGQVGDVGMHTMDGAVFKPGLSADAKPPTATNASAMVLGSTTDAKGRMLLLEAGGQLGEGSNKGIARKGDTTACGKLEILGGVSTSFAGLKYTAPDGTVTTINATGIQANLAGEIDTSSDSWTCED